MEFIKIVLLINLMISSFLHAAAKKEDLSKALIPYQSPTYVLFKNYQKSSPSDIEKSINKKEPRIGALHQLEKFQVVEFEKALSTRNEAKLKDLLSKGFDINVLNSKELYRFFKYTFEKNKYKAYPIVDLAQQIKDRGKRLFAIADLLMDRSIEFVYKQDIIDAFIKNIETSKIIKKNIKEYEISLLNGFDQLISNRQFRSTGIFDEKILNNIRNKNLSEFLDQKNNSELLFDKKENKIRSEVILPEGAFDFSEEAQVNKTVVAFKVYMDKIRQTTITSVSNWFSRLKAQTSSWFTSIKNWWNRR